MVSLIALVAFAMGARMLGSACGRAGPAGMFRGLFDSPGLDWPTGVQEEDRDRLWSWAQPVKPEEPLADVQELVEVREQAVSVSRVR